MRLSASRLSRLFFSSLVMSARGAGIASMARAPGGAWEEEEPGTKERGGGGGNRGDHLGSLEGGSPYLSASELRFGVAEPDPPV